jgi:hypothetical protein
MSMYFVAFPPSHSIRIIAQVPYLAHSSYTANNFVIVDGETDFFGTKEKHYSHKREIAD